MSLVEQETLEDVTGWLLQNKALAKSPEYRQKASLYMTLKTEKPKEGEAVEDLSVWLRSNKDKRSTSEYKSKAIQYMGLKKEAGTNVTGHVRKKKTSYLALTKKKSLVRILVDKYQVL